MTNDKWGFKKDMCNRLSRSNLMNFNWMNPMCFLYHTWDISVENVSVLNRIHVHAQCVNWSAGISYPYSRTCPLIGSFLLGFTYCYCRERKSGRIIIFRCSFIGYFFGGFHIVATGNVFLCLTMIQKKEHQNTRKSD
jgi:hypothetical protein